MSSLDLSCKKLLFQIMHRIASHGQVLSRSVLQTVVVSNGTLHCQVLSRAFLQKLLLFQMVHCIAKSYFELSCKQLLFQMIYCIAKSCLEISCKQICCFKLYIALPSPVSSFLAKKKKKKKKSFFQTVHRTAKSCLAYNWILFLIDVVPYSTSQYDILCCLFLR